MEGRRERGEEREEGEREKGREREGRGEHHISLLIGAS